MSSEKPESEEKRGDSFASLFERAEREAPPAPARRRKQIRVGDRLEAVVVQVGRELVFVELDGKQQAFLEVSEVRDPDGTVTVKAGDTIRAHVIEVDEAAGSVRLGRSIGRPSNLAAIEQAKESGVAVEGKVTGVNKGGLEVDLGGARAFCPSSQASDRFVEDITSLVGQTFHFVVTDVRDGGKSVVVSRRALLQREASENAAKAMVDIVPGAVLRGTVSSVRDFGAFVDLGGIEGLIPRSEIAHDRSVAVADALKPGDVVEVQVREVKDVDPSEGKPSKGPRPTKKITLSLKALAADPWAELDFVVGRVIEGTVVRSTEFGRFVRIAPAVEGLLHVSELGREFKAEEGEQVRVVIKKLDRETKKIGLVPAPDGAEVGSTIAMATTELKVNSVVTGTVERIETYGIFVQVDGTKGRAGRGLVPNAELGVPRGTDLRKAFPEGTKVKAKVLETGDGRLRLSIKGAADAEERADFEAAKGRQGTPKSLGTFADLLKGRKL